VRAFSRLGKRIVFECDPDLFLVVHLMIAGRLRWREGSQKAPPAKQILAELTFEHGRLYFTEAGSTRRAAMHVVRGRETVAVLDPGGIDPLTA
jgi:formamidopyrimidine-DNA glycosylase